MKRAVEFYVEHKRAEGDFAARAAQALEEIEREAAACRGAIQALFGEASGSAQAVGDGASAPEPPPAVTWHQLTLVLPPTRLGAGVGDGRGVERNSADSARRRGGRRSAPSPPQTQVHTSVELPKERYCQLTVAMYAASPHPCPGAG